MLSRFVDFVDKRVVSRRSVASHSSPGAVALGYARQILDELVAHDAFVRKL